MRILLVDDDLIFSELFTAKLAAQGFTQITVASSAEAALELVDQQQHSFDCYLLDIVLGEMDGIELCRQLRQRIEARTTPIIMITSKQTSHSMDAAFAAGATDFLRKPLNEVEIAGRIKTAMFLVEATNREKRTRKALKALVSCGIDVEVIDPNEKVCFSDVPNMLDYYQLENRMLRLDKGHYQLSVFRIRIARFREISKLADPMKLVARLHSASVQISEAASSGKMLFSYIGRGRFICCVMGRETRVSGVFENSNQITIGNRIRDLGRDDGDPHSLEIKALSERTILQRDAIVSLIRSEYRMVSSFVQETLPEIDMIEDQIFAKALAAEKEAPQVEDL
ncbi:response regulator [Pseudohalocynthiibacter aestuariivivens]|nr:response regulator [Pseudohalocynthiibacter aestuariivivens]QIE45547.1 response regulator [Pseudohalocynthiibacter aestuariivivens]